MLKMNLTNKRKVYLNMHRLQVKKINKICKSMKYQWESSAKYKNILENQKALNKFNFYKEKIINLETRFK